MRRLVRIRFGPLHHPEEADAAFPLPPGLVARLATGLRVLGEDLRLLVFPSALSVDPWPPTVESLWDSRLLWPLAAIAVVVVAIVACRRRPLIAGCVEYGGLVPRRTCWSWCLAAKANA